MSLSGLLTSRAVESNREGNWKDNLYWQRILLGFVAVKTVVLFARIWLPFGLPHVWRQVCTSNVALRYWMRFSQEEFSWSLFLPAVMSSGPVYGYNPMEFPILNLLVAPFFGFGLESGRVLSFLAVILINIALTALAYHSWRGKKILEVPAEWIVLLLPLMSVTSEYYGRYMPDYGSTLLIFAAMGYSWKRWSWLSFPLAALGLLMKPTSVIGFALLFLRGEKGKELIGVWFKRDFFWLTPAVLVAGIYFKFGNDYMVSITDTEYLRFDTTLVSFRESLSVFFSHPNWIGRFFNTIAIYPFIFFIITLSQFRNRRYQILLAVVGIQVFIMALLRGHKFESHYYHMIAASPVLIMCLLVFWQDCRQKWLRNLAAFIFCFWFVEHLVYEFKSLYAEKDIKYRQMYAECKSLKEGRPDLPWNQDYIFRTLNHEYSEISYCFGERTGSPSSEYGIYFAKEEFPSECEPIERTEQLVIVKCRDSASL